MTEFDGEMVRPIGYSKMNDPLCPYNIGVGCKKQDNCEKCGWLPKNVGLRNYRKRGVLRKRKEWEESRNE